jgi:hypothetical protein
MAAGTQMVQRKSPTQGAKASCETHLSANGPAAANVQVL